MILNSNSKQNVTVNAENTQKLSVSMNENDQAILLDLQINKLYKNKVRAVVQEYMSNARDANVDSGKSETPIQIRMPTHDNTVFSVRDFGIGMSPEIIRDYICVVGASTKRDNNNSLGCFGYGSKCGYAYVNENGQQFSITTVFQNVKYSYLLYYDDKHFPNVSLLAKEETTEPSGTIVEIPVAVSDVYSFNNEIRNILQYWVGVYNFEIVNSEFAIESKKMDVVVEHDNYVIFNNSRNSYRFDLTIIIGGIPYYYKMEHDVLNYCNVDIRMPIGSMNITPSREDLEITKNNTSKIKEVLDAAYEKLKEHYENEMTSIPNELEFYKKYSKKCPRFVFEKCKFNGNAVEFNRYNGTGQPLSNWLDDKSSSSSLENVVFIDMEEFKSANQEKISYNYPNVPVITLTRYTRANRWSSVKWNKLDKDELTPFSKNLLEQIETIAVKYSSLKSKPRTTEKSPEPTYWELKSSIFEPRFDEISNLTGVWFLGSSLKPVETDVELVLPRDGLSYSNPIGIKDKIYMIPKRNEKKVKENKNLINIMDRVKEILISPENISLLHSQIGIEIFGSNYLNAVLIDPNSVKDEIIKTTITKMAVTKAWHGSNIIHSSNTIRNAYKKVYGKDFSTPELDYLKSKYEICSKVRRLEYHEMKEIVDYIWSK